MQERSLIRKTNGARRKSGLAFGFGFSVLSGTFGLALPSPAAAQTIIDDWQKVKPPVAPELKTVTVDPKTTALLIFDFNGAQDPTKGPCNVKTKPRCLASVPKVKTLLDQARAKEMLVVFSLAGVGEPQDIATALAPLASEPIVKSGPDKFIGTNLRSILSDKGIKTIIVTGTASEGAVLDTATDAALNGMNIVLPVDGMSSTELYGEQYVAWHMVNAPGVSQKTTLTSIDRIKF
ncbi:MULTISPECIES: isochorismatase family protein [unclassified Rhizobium]|uniref:isochorismatase family protein n=1 Tax=unclassified Rhizobium TaxID=2613769 RepID=UPI001620C623|nr:MULTISPECIES: isochorismatase family protein [unclassified Rhizobium]MBB3386920.1 nicotinamidase-related amidase [Rhizobium sp. BK098]MBB3618573.1 nicotinamidase-related amidase [Rhizobium sp. BK609]MBB3684253.1 nicotinamidase-related amidase [Rhizobium sp. BK612]